MTTASRVLFCSYLHSKLWVEAGIWWPFRWPYVGNEMAFSVGQKQQSQVSCRRCPLSHLKNEAANDADGAGTGTGTGESKI